MSNRELIGAAFAFVGGFGGLASVLAWMNVVDCLNSRRSPDNQIPIAITSRLEWKRHWELIDHHGFWYRRELLWEFRENFPRNSSYYWYLGGLAWLFSFVVAGVIMVLR